ncbi:transcriptional regulator, TetR family [Treponema primitia ZAS-2]|uniref:Transcriptional regulator, TetR family n=1 Tax=Treponema primitia (strain ATCC BAA-887 / DSM 12427 / ZAS-2) TaxID=545694 RepID=F5YLT3_TREPZ|nr:TetR-like C-terminal domain-containing protein [Treponema primitia]AEF85373.1 transcriptional regulator, TetR family [Treponema primitia ZAS-2]
MENKQAKDNRKARYTRMVLRESLMELMKTKPISLISVKEICALADISRSTFYTYYADQYDLLRKTEEETLAFIDSISNKYEFYKNDKHGALQMMEEILQHVADNNKSIYVLFSENGNINFSKTLFSSMYRKNFSKFLTDKLPDEQTKEYYFMFLATGTIGIIYHWVNNGMNKSIHELAKLMINLIFQIKQ